LGAKSLLEGVVGWVREVNARASSPGVEVVVEGPKDIRSLRGVGIRATFIYASNLLREIADLGEGRVMGRTFIILTDLDREGEALHKRIKRLVTELGGRVVEGPRKSYISLGLPPMMEELENFVRRRFEDWDLLVEGLL